MRQNTNRFGRKGFLVTVAASLVLSRADEELKYKSDCKIESTANAMQKSRWTKQERHKSITSIIPESKKLRRFGPHVLSRERLRCFKVLRNLRKNGN